MIGLLASHTAELQENAPVIEVISFITEMAENVLNFRTHSFHGYSLNVFFVEYGSCYKVTSVDLHTSAQPLIFNIGSY